MYPPRDERHPEKQLMRALVVGAGAVGQVYARHLQLGGAEVAFLVKDKYAEECRRGFTMYALNHRRRTEPLRLEGVEVLTSPAQAAASRWDQIYVTVSSTAIRAGTWLAELAAASGDATIVSLQPGLHDRALFLEHWPESRVVSGMISLISYHAPLPDETRFATPGMAYWFPPLAPSPFSGPDARVRTVVEALRRGGMPATRQRDVPRAAAFPSAVLMPNLVALESAGWSFRELGRGAWLERAARASSEALAQVAHHLGTRPPLPVRLLARPFAMRLLLRVAGVIIPLPLETYLRVHFTKVGDQTRLAMATYVADARAAGLPTAALEQLSAQPALAATVEAT
jgi:hypothetical protein